MSLWRLAIVACLAYRYDDLSDERGKCVGLHFTRVSRCLHDVVDETDFDDFFWTCRMEILSFSAA